METNLKLRKPIDKSKVGDAEVAMTFTRGVSQCEILFVGSYNLKSDLEGILELIGIEFK